MEIMPKTTDGREKMSQLDELVLLIEQEMAAQEKIHGTSSLKQAFNAVNSRERLGESGYKARLRQVQRALEKKKVIEAGKEKSAKKHSRPFGQDYMANYDN
jgi:hypothetical protein